jgi:hypothetical protein
MTMNDFSLEAMLKSSGKRMRDDLAQRLIPHPAELGTDREEVIRQFLRAYLPKRFEVSSGFAFDSSGNASKQLDIVISNSLICPRLETAGGKRFFPCESVVAVGQVKSSLTSATEFQKALANLESAKSLDRSAKGAAIHGASGEEIDPAHNHLDQIFTFVFITGKALSGRTIVEELMELIHKKPPHVWPNIIFAMDKYLVTFCCDGGVCPNPMDARGIALQAASEQDEILMRFYLLLGRAVEVTRVSTLPYWEYLSRFTQWDAEAFYSSTDSPPPYLHTLRI